jgi:hypothetical protein
VLIIEVCIFFLLLVSLTASDPYPSAEMNRRPAMANSHRFGAETSLDIFSTAPPISEVPTSLPFGVIFCVSVLPFHLSSATILVNTNFL